MYLNIQFPTMSFKNIKWELYSSGSCVYVHCLRCDVQHYTTCIYIRFRHETCNHFHVIFVCTSLWYIVIDKIIVDISNYYYSLFVTVLLIVMYNISYT